MRCIGHPPPAPGDASAPACTAAPLPACTAVAYNPIYLPRVAPNASVPGCTLKPYNCSTCISPDGKQAFWGFATALLDVGTFTNTSLNTLRSKYLFRWACWPA